MKKYWFILGNFPQISTAEILAVMSLKKEYIQKENILFIDHKDFDAQKIIKSIGGTIKIGEEITNGLNEIEIIEKITNTLKDRPGKINFGISFYGKKDKYFIKNLAIKIKQNLKDLGKNGRFIFKNENILSSVTVEKNNLVNKGVEFLISEEQKKYSLAKTLAIQPFEDFGERDFGRPGRDKKSGMLPPKLALMMLNITGIKKDSTIFDPFCGSGTIVTEAILQGYSKVIGTDLSERAIIDTKKNISWIKEKKEFKTQVDVFQYDVKGVAEKIKEKSIDAICAEPFLGQPLRGHEPETFLKNQTEELKNLYLSAFLQFKKVLKPNGVVVFIIPRFKTKNDWITVNCKKEIEDMGFKAEPLNTQKNNYFLLYYREGQKVGREIWKFKMVDSQ